MGQDLSVGVPIVSLQAVDPMRVNFSLPQRALAVVSKDLPIRLFADAAPGQQFNGRINAIDTQIDNATRSVRIQATLDPLSNDTPLLPGMYSRVEVVLPKTDPYLVVPTTAISFATFGDSVFVIDSNDEGGLVARQQFVQLGERRGDFVAVTKGLQANQKVVSEGVFKLRNGAAISLSETGKIDPQLAPQPGNS
jgi:membrane fusion protein (multidrug efflux system)